MTQILQYIWIEKYGCIEEQEFNFTDRIRFHYDKEHKKITCEKNKKYYENFFGDNIELTCVVGQNGVGKTSLLRAIKKIFAKEHGGVNLNCIAIFYNGDKYEGWYYLSNGNNKSHLIKTDCEVLILHNHENKKLPNGNEVLKHNQKNKIKICEHFECEKARYIYLSEQLVSSQYVQPMGEDELSTSHLLYDAKISNNNIYKDHVNNFFLEEFERQMNLIIDYGKRLEKFKIKYTPYVTATLINDDDVFIGFIKKYIYNEVEVMSIYETFLRTQPLNNIAYFKDVLAKAIFLNIVNTFIHSIPKLNQEKFETFIKLMKNNSIGYAWENMRSLLLSDFLIKSSFFIPHLKGYNKFINYIDNMVEFSDDPFTFAMFKLNGNFTIPTIRNNYIVKTDIVTDIEEFFDEYRKVAEFHSFINFSWGLSSGEMSLLNIFSRLYSKIKKKELHNKKYKYYLPEEVCDKRTENKVVLLLDEIELNLHPEWQRNLINELLKFVKFAFNGSFIQIIMTTHSPIMLSDIPSQNVLYLTKDEKIGNISDHSETFGANIYKLYNEAFFMDKGAIGAYAQDRLSTLLDKIKNYANEEQKDIERQIDLIGDSFLKRKFESEFMKHLSIQNQIMEHKRIIAELEQKVAKVEKNGQN